MSNFYSYLHNFKDRRSQKYEVCICSNILGDSFVERLSTGFRRDLTLVLESAGVKGVKLVLSDDSRFIDTVISSHTVRKVFKKCARGILGMYPSPCISRGLGTWWTLNKENNKKIAKKHKNEKKKTTKKGKLNSVLAFFCSSHQRERHVHVGTWRQNGATSASSMHGWRALLEVIQRNLLELQDNNLKEQD